MAQGFRVLGIVLKDPLQENRMEFPAISLVRLPDGSIMECDVLVRAIGGYVVVDGPPKPPGDHHG